MTIDRRSCLGLLAATAAVPLVGRAAQQRTIALLFDSLISSFWVAAVERLRRDIHARGWSTLEAVSNMDDNRQYQQLQSMIQRGVDGVVMVHTDDKAVVPAIRAANRARVPLIHFNRPPAPNDGYSVAVVADNRKLMEDTVNALIEIARRRGGALRNAPQRSEPQRSEPQRSEPQRSERYKAAILIGDLGDANGVHRRDGFNAAVARHPEFIEVVARIATEWNADKAFAGLSNALQAHPDINFLVTSSDFLTPQIEQALRIAGKWHPAGHPEHVLIAGFDGDDNGYKQLAAGYWDVDGVQNLDYEVELTLRALDEIWAGRPPEKVLVDPGFVISRETLVAQRDKMWGYGAWKAKAAAAASAGEEARSPQSPGGSGSGEASAQAASAAVPGDGATQLSGSEISGSEISGSQLSGSGMSGGQLSGGGMSASAPAAAHGLKWALSLTAIVGFASALFSTNTLHDVLLAMLPLVILVGGQLLVLLIGQIDLSMTAVMAGGSILSASLMTRQAAQWDEPAMTGVGILACLAVGAAIGLFNGICTAILRIPSFIVTLATMMAGGGAAVWYASTVSDTISIGGLPEAFRFVGYGTVAGVPIALVLSLVVLALIHFVLSRTVTGRWLYAIGHNAKAARIAGVPVQALTIAAFTASGLCAALAALIYTSRIETGLPTLGQNMMLDIVGAAVIGGVSLFGGRGTIWMVLVGVAFLSVLDKSLQLLGLSLFVVLAVKGCAILAAVIVDVVRTRRRAHA